MDSHLILPALYLPPISYFHVIQAAKLPVLLEKHEHFPKQTYRARASIHSANGKLDLIVPVIKGHRVHSKIEDVRISYEADWQRLHWMSLQTSYRRSAYFEYYEDDFAVFYEQKYEFLLDFNVAQLILLLRLLKMDLDFGYTTEYRQDYEARLDFREQIHPKKKTSFFTPKPYYQVFEAKNGFFPDLSIVDLLFNQGPKSRQYF